MSRNTALVFFSVVISLTARISLPAENGPPWEEAARAAIAANRMGEKVIVLRDGRGEPMAGVRVQARLQRHDFMFGSQISSKREFDAERPHAARYRQEFERLFNTVVLGSEHKMALWEALPTRSQVERAHAWARQAGLDWRGHTLVWGATQYSPVVPPPFHEMLKAKKPVDRDALLRRIDESIVDRVLRMRGVARHWDVLNEPISEQRLFESLGAKTASERAALVKRWFDLAHAIDPQAKLYLNEFGILVTKNQRKRDQYFELAKEALAMGAPIHGIGFQAHVWGEQQANDPDTIRQILDRFAGLGVELSITEYDTYGPWGSDQDQAEAAQAENLRQLLLAFYAHPAARAFLVWGIYDGTHWKRSAPFYREDWTPKPGLKVFENLVWDEWATSAEAVTDAEGTVRFSGHYGLYQVTFAHGEEEYTVLSQHHPEKRVSNFLWRREAE